MCVNLDRFPHGCTSCRNLVPQHQAPKKRSLVFHWDDPMAIETEETPQAREQREQWLGSTTVWILGNFWGIWVWYLILSHRSDRSDRWFELKKSSMNVPWDDRDEIFTLRVLFPTCWLPSRFENANFKISIPPIFPSQFHGEIFAWCFQTTNFIIFQCSTGWSQGLPHVSGLKKALGSHFFHHRILADPEAWIFWVPPKSGYPVTLWYFNSLRTGQWP